MKVRMAMLPDCTFESGRADKRRAADFRHEMIMPPLAETAAFIENLPEHIGFSDHSGAAQPRAPLGIATHREVR